MLTGDGGGTFGGSLLSDDERKPRNTQINCITQLLHITNCIDPCRVN